MTIESQLTKHLIAELFAKTGKLIAESPVIQLEDILSAHENFLVGLLNNSRLLLGYKNVQPLTGINRGFAPQSKIHQKPMTEDTIESGAAGRINSGT